MSAVTRAMKRSRGRCHSENVSPCSLIILLGVGKHRNVLVASLHIGFGVLKLALSFSTWLFSLVSSCFGVSVDTSLVWGWCSSNIVLFLGTQLQFVVGYPTTCTSSPSCNGYNG